MPPETGRFEKERNTSAVQTPQRELWIRISLEARVPLKKPKRRQNADQQFYS